MFHHISRESELEVSGGKKKKAERTQAAEENRATTPLGISSDLQAQQLLAPPVT